MRESRRYLSVILTNVRSVNNQPHIWNARRNRETVKANLTGIIVGQFCENVYNRTDALSLINKVKKLISQDRFLFRIFISLMRVPLNIWIIGYISKEYNHALYCGIILYDRPTSKYCAFLKVFSLLTSDSKRGPICSDIGCDDYVDISKTDTVIMTIITVMSMLFMYSTIIKCD